MAGLNKVFLMGNLTRDPEIRYTSSGSPVTNFGLAVNRIYTTQSGERKEDACFVKIVVFGKQAETCSKYLSKGRLVLVQGRLQYHSWETEGKKRSMLEVIGEGIHFLPATSRAEDRKEKKEVKEVEEEIFLEEEDAQDKKDEKDEDIPF